MKTLTDTITGIGADVKTLKESVDPETVKALVQEAVVEKVGEVLPEKVDEIVKAVFAKYTGEEGDLTDAVEELVKGLVGKNSPDDGQNGPGAAYVAKFTQATKFDNVEWNHLAFANGLLKHAAGKPTLDGSGKVAPPSDELKYAFALRTIHDADGADQKWAAREAAI